MSDRLQIYIDGNIYSQWKRVEIVKDLEAVSGAFDITLTRPEVFTFVPGKALRIDIEGIPVIDGYIDEVKFSGKETEFQLNIIGRDRTADLIDCSAITTSSEFLNISLENLAKELCSPFGISVISNTAKASQKISKVSMQKGSVYEELEREARKVGVFLYPDSKGDLILDEIGSQVLSTRLVIPGNILSFSGSINLSNVFSEYRVKGQQGSAGTLTPKQQTQVNAKATDNNVGRYRPLIIVSGSNLTSSQAKAQVEWEAAVRAGRSEELSLKLEGWTDQNAELWSVNKLVSVNIEPLEFEDQMLIKSVAFRYNETDGQVTELTLSDPQAYVPKPVIEKKTGKKRILPGT